MKTNGFKIFIRTIIKLRQTSGIILESFWRKAVISFRYADNDSLAGAR